MDITSKFLSEIGKKPRLKKFLGDLAYVRGQTLEEYITSLFKNDTCLLGNQKRDSCVK